MKWRIKGTKKMKCIGIVRFDIFYLLQLIISFDGEGPLFFSRAKENKPQKEERKTFMER
jgi:hypothetical protein